MHGDGLSHKTIANKMNLHKNVVCYWLDEKRKPKEDVDVYKREVNRLRNRLIECEARETTESKVQQIEDIIGLLEYPPSDIEQAFVRAKAKFYKADEMLSDVLMSLYSHSR